MKETLSSYHLYASFFFSSQKKVSFITSSCAIPSIKRSTSIYYIFRHFHLSASHSKKRGVSNFEVVRACTKYARIYVGGEPAVSCRRTRWSLRKHRLRFETSGELPTILEESIEYASIEWKQKWKMSTCNRLNLESLGSWPTLYAQKLPGHGSEPFHGATFGRAQFCKGQSCKVSCG